MIYGAYVWTAYGISASAIIIVAGVSWCIYRKYMNRVQKLATKF